MGALASRHAVKSRSEAKCHDLVVNFFLSFLGFLEFLENLRKKIFGLFPHEIFFGSFFQQKCHSEKIFRSILNLIKNINFRENLSGMFAYQI